MSQGSMPTPALLGMWSAAMVAYLAGVAGTSDQVGLAGVATLLALGVRRWRDAQRRQGPGPVDAVWGFTALAALALDVAALGAPYRSDQSALSGALWLLFGLALARVALRGGWRPQARVGHDNLRRNR